MSQSVPTVHEVDVHTVSFHSCDVATWLLFFLEAHGARVVLTETDNVTIDLNPLPGMTDETADRWCPVITALMPEMRSILRARARATGTGAVKGDH